MSTPQSTPAKHVKLGIVSAKSLPLTSEFKRLLSDQHQRLSLKNQQDLDLIDDIRSYVKSRLAIEKEYTNALQKLAKHHSSHINKKFTLLQQLDQQEQQQQSGGSSHQISSSETSGLAIKANSSSNNNNNNSSNNNQNNADKSGCGSLTTHHNHLEPLAGKSYSLYKVWSDHINCLQNTSKNRADQFEQSNLIVDKLKDIRQHKASIGKKCLDTHLKRIQEDLLLSVVDVERAKKLYYEDESQAKKARENEERIKKKRSGLLTKFTDLQAKKEKSSAQREATDIQSTQARNDYIMALAAANAHLNYYYYRDLSDFIQLIDDGVLDHCKIFMATLSECDINSLKDWLSHAQYWSRLINLTGSHQTNQIFLDCDQSTCLRDKHEIHFEPCNQDPISKISLEHNADYALQHEIDKWFTWFKKECRNLSQLMHQLDTCQRALAEGKKSVEFNGQMIDDLEPKVIELKQHIRKSEAAKLKAQARLSVIRDGGMQIEEWNAVELEIRADMARAQEEQQRAKRLREPEKSLDSSSHTGIGGGGGPGVSFDDTSGHQDGGGGQMATSSSVHLRVSRDSDDVDGSSQMGGGGPESMHNLASVSRSTSNLMHEQQPQQPYSALTDPSLVWQDDYSSAWGGQAADERQQQQPSTVVQSPTSPTNFGADSSQQQQDTAPYDFQPDQQQHQQQQPGEHIQKQHIPNASMSIQSSSPLSAIVNGGQHLSQSPYQGVMSEAYKSDYECDYTRSGHHTLRSAASSVEPTGANNHHHQQQQQQHQEQQVHDGGGQAAASDVSELLNRQVVALYKFEKTNEDDLDFEESDLLEVIEINSDDTNWVKARHLATHEEGYIPSSYIRLHELVEGADSVQQQSGQQLSQQQPTTQPSAWSSMDGHQTSDVKFTASTNAQDDIGDSSGLDCQRASDGGAQQLYCRALYDYKSDNEAAFEEDGLPHLSLVQGELMRVVDQGEDDGWWLVEKEDTGTRGHVPSMLVEEVDPNEPDEGEEEIEGDEQEEEDLEEDGDVSEEAYDREGPLPPPPQGPPPTIEPPVLEMSEDNQLADDDDVDDGAQTQVMADNSELTSADNQYDGNCPAIINADEVEQENSHNNTVVAAAVAAADESTKDGSDTTANQKTTNSSLIPTSFIIIEPTPEVESRRFEDAIQATGERDTTRQVKDDDDDENNAQGKGKDINNNNNKDRDDASGVPCQGVSYSVVNEDFVLERPSRKPQVGKDATAFTSSEATASGQHHHHHHHQPHDLTGDGPHEPTISEEDEQLEEAVAADQHDQPEAPIDDMPSMPAVVIDTVEAIPRSPDLSLDEADEAAQSWSQDQTSEAGGGASGAAGTDSADQESNASGNSMERRQIKRTANVDCSPILRHHVDEFTKQLIEEALMLAPGSHIGPSTSSADMRDQEQEEEEDDYQDDNGQNYHRHHQYGGDGFHNNTENVNNNNNINNNSMDDSV